MTDIDKAAERVRRIANGELGVAVYFPEHRGSVYANNTLDRAADMARDDRRTLADAYLTQQPSYAAQSAEIESAWKMIESEFDIEPRAQIEAEAKTNGFKHGLAQAIHTIWKRDAKVTELAAEIAELRARLAAAEKNRDDLLNTAATLGEQVCRDKPRRDRLASFEDEQVVDEAWCRAKFGEAWATSGDCAIYRTGVIYVRINYELVRKDIKEIVTVSLHGLDVLEMPTVGQLNHLLAALRPGGVK